MTGFTTPHRAASAALLFTACLTFATSPAMAEVPEPVRDMINAAIATGNPEKVATVLEIAKSTNPDDTAELDAIAAEFTAQQSKIAAEAAAKKEADIRNAGLFENWSGEGQIGGFRSTGNSSSIGLTAGVKLTRTGIDWRHKLRALTDYQRTNGATSREQFLLSYEPNYQMNERMFVYALGQYERDRFQGFSSRISASGGVGWDVIDTDKTELSVKAGPAYRNTSFITGGSDKSLSALAALDFDWRISSSVKLTQDASAYVQSGNSTYISATGLESKLGKRLSARASYTVEHNTNPPTASEQTDTLTRFTLVYGF